MRIERVDCFLAEVPYQRPFIIAGGPSTVAEHVIVRLVDQDGAIGVGEAAGMISYSEETPEDSMSAIHRYLASVVIGRDALDFEGIHAAMDRALPGHTYAKAAIDLALYDLAGKRLGVPAYKLLGGASRAEVQLAWAVGLGTIDEMVAEAVRYAAHGYGTIKLKIGRDPRKDLDVVRAVREAIGDDVGIRVDGNQGYTADTAIKTLRRMEAYDLQLIEQPVPRWDVDGMAKVAAALDTPIMADEGVFDLHDAVNLIRARAADIFNIKIMKPGGLYPSKKLAAVAEAAGIPCLVGSMIEMGIGTAAGVHFAVSTPAVTYPSELIGPPMLVGDVIQEDHYAPDRVKGVLPILEAPGLGVTLLTTPADRPGTLRYRKWGEE